MPDTNYFWQGGRRIEIQQDDTAVTIHAENANSAHSAAFDAGVELNAAAPAGPGMIRANVVGDRDAAIDRLRATDQVVHHVYRDRQENASEYLITESFFIKFKKGTSEAAIHEYFTSENLVVEQVLENLTFLVRVTEATGRNPIRTANAAASRPDVEYAEPNLVRQVTRFFIPPDSLFNQQWHLHAPAAGTDLVVGAGIFAADAWDTTRGRREIVVAVADDGFDLTHPDFQGAGKVAAQLNATPRTTGAGATIDWDADVHPRAATTPNGSGDYHGTPCLGVAVAEGNGTGVVGVAPGCALAAVRFPLSMSDGHFIAMFRKISTIADVVSCSWGVPPTNAPMSLAFKQELTTLSQTGGRRGKGLVICVAAGNNNAPVQDLANTRTYQYAGRTGIVNYSGAIDRWIAAHPDVITVSAVTSRKTRSAYSSWGKQISVCASSDNWHDLTQAPLPGRGITTTDNENLGAGTEFSVGSRFTNRFGGTSSATPTVAGVAALVLSANSALTAVQVKQILQGTADQDLSVVTDTPVNEPGAFTSGFSLWFGHGKVNAAKAVAQAAALASTDVTVDLAAEPALAIPDVGAPVSSTIQVAQNGTIQDIRIMVDITHTYIGDLRVDLIAPDGTTVVLHNNSGGSAHNIVKTYAAQEVAALRGLIGHAVHGTWRLQVRDSFRLDVGRLNKWRIVARVA